VVYIIIMKILFLKDVTVEVMEPSSGTNDTYDKLIRANTVIDVEDITPLSKNFSNLYVSDEIWVNLRNDLFQQVV
jgi:ribosomal protein S11